MNLLGLLFVSLFNIEDLEITHKGPSEIQPGEFTEITIEINKGDFSGPARLKLNFENADGLTPFEVNSAGSSFTMAALKSQTPSPLALSGHSTCTSVCPRLSRVLRSSLA